MRTSPVRVLVVVGCLLGLVACGSPSSPAPPGGPAQSPRPLRILLVNDDGWDAPGIVAVRQGLVAAGNSVTEVAPAAGESGTGAALTFSGPLQVLERAPGVWSVTGRPSDAALVGLRSVLGSGPPPDLVVSGINSAYNAGATAVHSGTVGAALTAAEFGVPAVAVSTDSKDPAGYAPSADYAVRLVGALSARPAPLLPPGTVVNVNYPAGRARAAGVVATEVAAAPQVDITYTPGAPGTVIAGSRVIPPADGPGGTDLNALARNQVSVGALDVDFSIGTDARASATALAGAVGP